VSAEVNVPDAAIGAGWHQFRYPRPATDEPTDAFVRGLRAAAPLILAAELERLIADRTCYDDAGNFRPMALINRLSELKKESR
jgi:hypothetical protein